MQDQITGHSWKRTLLRILRDLLSKTNYNLSHIASYDACIEGSLSAWIYLLEGWINLFEGLNLVIFSFNVNNVAAKVASNDWGISLKLNSAQRKLMNLYGAKSQWNDRKTHSHKTSIHWKGALGKKATSHQLTTMLATSNKSYFQVITTMLITSTNDPTL